MREIHQWPVVSLTKGQWRGKCFHLMTSSCAWGPRGISDPAVCIAYRDFSINVTFLLLWPFNWTNSQIPQCTCSMPHNAPFIREICTSVQNNALGDMAQVHCGICEIGLLPIAQSAANVRHYRFHGTREKKTWTPPGDASMFNVRILVYNDDTRMSAW